MKSVSQFIVKVANLAEAEGRLVKHHTVKVLQAAIVFAAGGLLLVVGLIALAAAAYLGLHLFLPEWAALGIVALIPIILGAIGWVVGKGLLEQ